MEEEITYTTRADNKPIIKLLSMWQIDKEHNNEQPPLTMIAHGIWMAYSVEEFKGEDDVIRRNYKMLCVMSYHPDVLVGTEIKMNEVVICELCHEVKIVAQPKYKSLMNSPLNRSVKLNP